MKRVILLFVFALAITSLSYGGNPDRQGEAGASELLLNPWAKSAGVHSMSTSYAMGVEAMRVNVAGMSRVEKGEIVVSHGRLYEGSTLGITSFGLVSKRGDGALGVSFTSLDFGDIRVTTSDQPEGTGGTYSPSFINLAVGYSHTFSNKEEGGGSISVGFLARMISETLPTVSAFGLGLDAGVQYVSGEKDEFKLGISLRNVGTPMEFGGDGLGTEIEDPGSEGTYTLTGFLGGEDFDLPTVLDIGLSYDFYLTESSYLRALGNFTSNAFSRDQIGVGLEFNFNRMVTLRGGYRLDLGEEDLVGDNIYTGFAGGVSIDVPLKRADNRKVGIDYAYRTTNPFNGTHNFGLRFAF